MVDVQTSMKKRMVLGKGNSPGPYKVTVSTPIPLREVPLEGTKSMITPRDLEFSEMMSRRPDFSNPEPSKLSIWMGNFAFLGAVVSVLVIWSYQFTDVEWFPYSILALTIFGTHILVIFSQIYTGGRHLLSSLALPIFYAGLILTWMIQFWIYVYLG